MKIQTGVQCTDDQRDKWSCTHISIHRKGVRGYMYMKQDLLKLFRVWYQSPQSRNGGWTLLEYTFFSLDDHHNYWRHVLIIVFTVTVEPLRVWDLQSSGWFTQNVKLSDKSIFLCHSQRCCGVSMATSRHASLPYVEQIPPCGQINTKRLFELFLFTTFLSTFYSVCKTVA